jgi:RimJ/RimL family protein N-acetyltransferase
MIQLETTRLLLRPPQASDLDAFLEIHEDPEVMRHITVVGPSGGRAAAWRTLALLIGHWHLRGYGQWTVVEKASDQVIGRVGLWNPEGWPGLEVGWLIRRSRWGHGFATEAARTAVQFGFDVVGADKLISIIRPDNVRSIRLAARIGETLDRVAVLEGVDVHIYSICRPSGPRAARAQPPTEMSIG